MDFGFTYLIEDDLQIPQCVVCMKTFSNSTMKPASLKQRLANAHPSMMSKNRSSFESKLSSLKRQKLDQAGMFWRTNKAAVHASYAIALHVAKTKKPHNIGETLLKPCILESVKLVLGEKASQTIKQRSLSNAVILKLLCMFYPFNKDDYQIYPQYIKWCSFIKKTKETIYFSYN